jgi:hypothetical protein
MANPVDIFLFALLIRGFGSGGERGGPATTGACGGGKLGRGLKCQLARIPLSNASISANEPRRSRKMKFQIAAAAATGEVVRSLSEKCIY